MIADSSSLILLAKMELLDITIQQVKEKLTIAAAVREECLMKEDRFDARLIKKRIEENLITVKNIKQKVVYNKIKEDFNLGKGEAEAITLRVENKGTLLSDDKRAMNACRVLQVPFITVPHILVMLKNKNIIDKDKAKMCFTKLKQFGRYSEDILQNIKEDLEK